MLNFEGVASNFGDDQPELQWKRHKLGADEITTDVEFPKHHEIFGVMSQIVKDRQKCSFMTQTNSRQRFGSRSSEKQLLVCCCCCCCCYNQNIRLGSNWICWSIWPKVAHIVALWSDDLARKGELVRFGAVSRLHARIHLAACLLALNFGRVKR